VVSSLVRRREARPPSARLPARAAKLHLCGSFMVFHFILNVRLKTIAITMAFFGVQAAGNVRQPARLFWCRSMCLGGHHPSKPLTSVAAGRNHIRVTIFPCMEVVLNNTRFFWFCSTRRG